MPEYFQRAVLHQGLKSILTESREKLTDTLTVLDGFLSNTKWVAGNNITIADYSILGTITTVKVGPFIHIEIMIDLLLLQEFGYDLLKNPNLSEWYSRCESFPGFQENVEGAQYLAKRMFAILENGKF